MHMSIIVAANVGPRAQYQFYVMECIPDQCIFGSVHVCFLGSIVVSAVLFAVVVRNSCPASWKVE